MSNGATSIEFEDEPEELFSGEKEFPAPCPPPPCADPIAVVIPDEDDEEGCGLGRTFMNEEAAGLWIEETEEVMIGMIGLVSTMNLGFFGLGASAGFESNSIPSSSSSNFMIPAP